MKAVSGNDWRHDNAAEDGVLIRTDLHRLLDRGLAELWDGRIWLSQSVRTGEDAQLHDRTPAA